MNKCTKNRLNQLLAALMGVGLGLSAVSAEAARSVQYTYTTEGLIASIDGPRTDVTDLTTYGYDTQGNRTLITNALGQQTQITQHDGAGRPLTMIDANGVVTTLTYDPRGRLLTRTTAGNTTSFTYDPVGNLTSITQPNGASITYTYDAADRLVGMSDGEGNQIDYTLDAMGNRIKEDVKDPNSVLKRTHSQVFDQLGRMIETLGASNQSITHSYDPNGNQTGSTDPNQHSTTQAFDALNRLITTTDAASGLTQYGYDAQDNLTSVTDPRGLTTTYTYDGLGNLTQQQSPDTGSQTYTYDEAGNRLTATDARGITATYAYDALNRLTSISYPDSTYNATYTYDAGNHGTSRLTGMTDETGATSYSYDTEGNIINKTCTQEGISYTTAYNYDGANNLAQMTYPSGRVVNYNRDSEGKITGITTQADSGSPSETVANNIQYQPFGPITQLTYGNGLSSNSSFDQDYRLTQLSNPGILERGYSYDGADNITGITDSLDSQKTQGFTYDNLDRLTDATGTYGSLNYGYDAVGNRTTKNDNGSTESYQVDTNSNQLDSITGQHTTTILYDANGNTIQKGTTDYIYNPANRLAEIYGAGDNVFYGYNGKGERVRKQVGSDITHFHYDTQGHLIGETNAQGETLAEYLYADGSPIGLITTATEGNQYVHLDGSLGEWNEGDRIDKAPEHQPVNGYRVYARHQDDTFYLAIQSDTLSISSDSTLWLNTDLNATTGYQVWGSYVGAEYNVNIYSDGTPHLYTGSDGDNWQSGPLSHAYSADGRTLELAIPASSIGSVSVLDLYLDINDSQYLPEDYSAAGYRVPAKSNIALDGNISDWSASTPLETVNGYTLHGKIAGDYVYLALASSTGAVISTDTTFWLNTDQDTSTGYQVWGSAVGAEYNINLYADNTPHLYTGEAGDNWQMGPLVHGRSTDGSVLEMAIPVSALAGMGNALSVWVDINDQDFLPLDYSSPGYVVAEDLSNNNANPEPALYYVHTDHLGTPVAITNTDQQAVWQHDSKPFGKTVSLSASLMNNLRFPGQYYDAETGLHYNYFRTYDPSTGRYLESDPIGLSGGLNTYSYVAGNPLRYFDLLGLIITGEWDGFNASVSDWDYTGFNPHTERAPDGNVLVDRLGYLNFLISGNLGAKVKCKDTDECNNVKREWTLGGSVAVNDLDFRVPLDEPAMPIQGMGLVILVDKILRTSQYMYEWRGMVESAGKALLNTPTLICRGRSFIK